MQAIAEALRSLQGKALQGSPQTPEALRTVLTDWTTAWTEQTDQELQAATSAWSSPRWPSPEEIRDAATGRASAETQSLRDEARVLLGRTVAKELGRATCSWCGEDSPAHAWAAGPPVRQCPIEFLARVADGRLVA